MTHGKEFRAYMKAANRTPGNDERHLNEAEVIAYCRGEMVEAEREAAQAHLVGCEQCIALFRSASDFLEPARPDEEEVTAAETNEAWRSLSQHVQTSAPQNAGGAGTTVVQADFQRLRDKKFFLDSRITLAMAATLLISFSAIGWLGWRFWQERQSRRQSQEVAMQLESRQRELERRLLQLEQSGGDEIKRERDERLAAEAERDRLQALLAAVKPDRDDTQLYSFRLSSERGSGVELPITFSRGAKAVRVRLLRYKPDEFKKYAIELLDQRGQSVWGTSGIRPTGYDHGLNFVLNRAKLTAGKYRLRLFGLEGKTRKQLEENELSVTMR
jgi:hypothetical protein